MAVTGIAKETIEIPAGVQVSVQGRIIKVKGPKGEQTREMPVSRLKVSLVGKSITLSCILPKKKESALLGTMRSHVNNMIYGVTKGFEYKMKVVYSHFPVKTSVKGNLVMIENFLGEKFPRTAVILGDTKVIIKGDEVTLTGSNRELVGQTAANIEQATKIRDYDPRIFQDGIYIVKKGAIQ
jgi:large subunit ribosomal protein L6